METTTPKVILTALKNDLKEKFNLASGYNFDLADVKIGNFFFQDFKIKPAIGIWGALETPEEYKMGGVIVTLLSIKIYAFLNTDGVSNNLDVYDMSQDIRAFVKSTNFTYKNDVIIGEVFNYPGGPQDKQSISITDIEVRYNQV